jgi:hypothetical protein
MSKSSTGTTSYFVTPEELHLLGYLVYDGKDEHFENRIPAITKSADWEGTLNRLIEKNYVRKAADGIVFDRVIGIIVRLIGGSDSCLSAREGRGHLYINKDAVIWMGTDERCAGRYRLVPMKSVEDFSVSTYAEEIDDMEEVSWKK